MHRSRLLLLPALAVALALLVATGFLGTAPAVHAAGPTINPGGVSPSGGPAAGGNPVTISGTGFDPATNHTTVSFGPNQSTSVDCNVGGTQCTAIAPPAIGLGGTNPVDVKVTAFGASATAAAAYTYDGPIITNLSPNSGPAAGGTAVTITGSNFTGATKVTFDGIVASFVVSSTSPDTTLTATSPPHAPSGTPILVQVTTGAAMSSGTLDNTDGFKYVSTVTTVTGVSPNSGPVNGGNIVVISGTGFTGATGVAFGTCGLGCAASFTVNSDTQITAIVPPSTLPGSGAGNVNVSVSAPGGTSTNPVTYTYTVPNAPIVTGINPTKGPTSGGTSVTISGKSFTTATFVNFGPTAASFTINSDTQIIAISPGGPAGVVGVTVTNPTATSAPVNFTYQGISLTGVNPTSGPVSGGNSVTLSGSGFTGATSVTFGGGSASFTVNSDTQITATPPAHAAGPVPVQVGNGGATSNTVTYTYGSTSTPIVTGVNPTSGPVGGGNTVIITGSNFTGATGVSFGGNSASFTVNSDTQITATAPAHAAGTVQVTVSNANGASNGVNYTYGAASGPIVTGINPTHGPTSGNTSVIISGSNFTGATTVNFGAVSTPFTINSDTQITAITLSAPAGVVGVTVTNGSGTSSPAVNYTFQGVSLTGVNPTAGPVAGGNTVILTGVAFTGATDVQFGAGNHASFTVNSDTQITATAPAAPGNVPGPVQVQVFITPATASNTVTYTYANPPKPTITGVNPTSGPVGGGNTVIVSGTGFSGFATSLMFGTASASFTVNSDTQITATAPHSPLGGNGAGSVTVHVTTAGGTDTNNVMYQYVTPPTPVVTGVVPNNGPTTGGNTVSINGSGFSGGATSVTFGGAAASFTVVSDTQISASVPASPLPAPGTGSVTVSVTTAGGTGSCPNCYTYTSIIPTVTSVFPNAGPANGGTSITISGSGFSTTPGATNVNFGTTQVPASDINCTTTSQCTVVTPAGVGKVDITVIVSGQQSLINPNDVFHFVPVVTSINPTGGPTGGGTIVTIIGAGFDNTPGNTTIAFGTVAGTAINCISATQCTVTSPASVPAGSIGPVDVRVTVAGETSPIVQPADQFTYFAIAMTLSGRTDDFTFTARTITVKVNGNFCASITQSFTQLFSIGLPTSCGGGAITFFIGAAPAGYVTSTGATCITFQPGINFTNMKVGTSRMVNTSCFP